MDTEAVQETPSNTPESAQTDTRSENLNNFLEKEGVKTKEPQKPSDFVEFDKPEQQKKFNKLYKDYKNLEKETYEIKNIAAQQFQYIEELRKSQESIVNHINNEDYTKAEKELRAAKKEARDRGDWDYADQVDDKLIEIKAAKLLKSQQPEKPKEQAPQQRQAMSGDEIIRAAVAKGVIDEDDADAYKAWANEKDDRGNLVRPWVNANDARSMQANRVGQAVWSSPALEGRGIQDKLSEIDRLMGVENRRAQQTQNVMGANLTPQNKSVNNQRVNVSDDIARLAVRTKFAGNDPKLTDKDHVDAYRKQLEKRGRK